MVVLGRNHQLFSMAEGIHLAKILCEIRFARPVSPWGIRLSALAKCLSMGMDGLVYLFVKICAPQLLHILGEVTAVLLVIEKTMLWNGENVMNADLSALETYSHSHF